MKQSRYDSAIHHGTQPIRVLNGNVLHWFENAEKDFLETLKGEVNYNALQNGIGYINSETKVEEVAYAGNVGETKKITIQETFLSYLWTISYGLVVMFDEVIMRPRIENGYIQTLADIERVKKAQALFDYGLSLLKSFSTWDKDNLPNPEYYDPADNTYIEKINSVYLAAVNFVLVHEFAHVTLGHIDQDIERGKKGEVTTKEEIRTDEFAADNYSFQTLINGAEYLANQSSVRMGILAGLCSLLFFSSSLDGDDHPDPDDRIKIMIEKLNLEETDNLWGIASLALKLWSNHYKVDLKLPAVVDTYKDLFYIILDRLSNYGHRNGSL
jgi:hypothetical protein